MRKVLVKAISIVLVANAAIAAQLITTKSKDATSKDIPLQFKLEKTTWERDNIYIWGTVKNTGQVKYRYVEVVVTAKDARGKFIGRRSWFVEPDDIGPGQVGYTEKQHVECEGRKPALLEYSVLGDK